MWWNHKIYFGFKKKLACLKQGLSNKHNISVQTVKIMAFVLKCPVDFISSLKNHFHGWQLAGSEHTNTFKGYRSLAPYRGLLDVWPLALCARVGKSAVSRILCKGPDNETCSLTLRVSRCTEKTIILWRKKTQSTWNQRASFKQAPSLYLDLFKFIGQSLFQERCFFYRSTITSSLDNVWVAKWTSSRPSLHRTGMVVSSSCCNSLKQKS